MRHTGITSHGPGYRESRVYVTTSVQVSVWALAPACYRCMATLSDGVTPACITVLGPGQTASWHLKDGLLQPNNLVN